MIDALHLEIPLDFSDELCDWIVFFVARLRWLGCGPPQQVTTASTTIFFVIAGNVTCERPNALFDPDLVVGVGAPEVFEWKRGPTVTCDACPKCAGGAEVAAWDALVGMEKFDRKLDPKPKEEPR